MTIDERKRINNKIVELLYEVNSIENDERSSDNLKHHIRCMVDTVKIDAEKHKMK